MPIIMLNCKNFSNKIILIHLKLNFKKNHFKMQFNQLHIQLHPILPNTFITETMANGGLNIQTGFCKHVSLQLLSGRDNRVELHVCFLVDHS